MNIILLGAPGAGKGTQASRLREFYGFVHLSTGELLRAEIADKTELGRHIQGIIDAGFLVPDDVIFNMIAQKIEYHRDQMVLDGFPRNMSQAQSLDDLMGQLGLSLDHVVLIEVDETQLIKRITGRFTCSKCLTGYHQEFKPTQVAGVCDMCGSKDFIRRRDDSKETVMARLGVFKKETESVVPYYEAKGLLRRVDGMVHIDDVTKQIKDTLGI